MKVKVKFRYFFSDDGFEYTGIYALINWPQLELYCSREQFAGIPNHIELFGYLQQWFSDDRFCPAFIGWDDKKRSLYFINGRHRVALISKYQHTVPVILCGQSILYPEIHRAIVKILNPDDIIDLPDLPFVLPQNMHPSKGEFI
ncbi:MAG: hypothetical protein WC959_01485 [Kiritimatiellales bacterium]